MAVGEKIDRRRALKGPNAQLYKIAVLPRRVKSDLIKVLGAGFEQLFSERAGKDVLTAGVAQARIKVAKSLAKDKFSEKLHKRVLELYESINTDDLTGLKNSKAMKERLGSAVSNASRKNGAVSLIVFDIDNFKSINDVYGHAFGSKVLRQVADRVKSIVRTGDVACRYGGDEFVVICPDTSARAVKAVAERIRQALCKKSFYERGLGSTGVSGSFGCHTITCEGRVDIDEVVKTIFFEADRQLYRSKKEGKNRVSGSWSTVSGELERSSRSSS